VVFSSHIFVYYFLPLALAGYYALSRAPNRWRNFLLILTGYTFYGWAEPRFMPLMFLTTFVDWLVSLIIAHDTWRFWRVLHKPVKQLPLRGHRSRTQRNAILISVVLNLATLGFFKYFNFGIESYNGLIQALGLNFKHVTAGAEPAQVARWSQLYKQKKPVIFYWYTPQYLNQEYDLAEVKLPPRTEANKDCKDDAKEGGDPEQYKCEYDITIINKLFSKKFADSGSPAYDVLKKMKLTNEDQEQVAKAIAGDKEDPEKAGQDWVDANSETVDAWLE
jgi:hypothetical protein